MLFTLLALAAAGAPRPLTPAERTIIKDAVLSALSTPGTLGFPPITGNDQIYCGRVSGSIFKVDIKRDKAGKIVAADNPLVISDDIDIVIRLAGLRNCVEAGYPAK